MEAAFQLQAESNQRQAEAVNEGNKNKIMQRQAQLQANQMRLIIALQTKVRNLLNKKLEDSKNQQTDASSQKAVKLALAMQSKVRDMLAAKNEELKRQHNVEISRLQAQMQT